MLLEQHLLQLFGNLPYLSKAEITKHLDKFDLMKAFLVSENWDEAVESRKNDATGNQIKIPVFFMFSKEDRVEMKILEYRSSGKKKLSIDFPIESALESSTEIVENGVRMICRSQNFEECENRILATFHKLRTWFDVRTCAIEVNLDLGFNLEFLRKLRLEKLNSFDLSGDKEGNQVDGKELSDLMKTWNIEGDVQIRVETIGKFKGNLKMLRGLYCEFTDSRWITADMHQEINKFVGNGGTFKRCLLTSEDFNSYFKTWRNTNKYYYALECHMEHELDVEKVLDGLEAKKWDPKIRGRIFKLEKFPPSNSSEFYRCYRTHTFIDLADGMDISRSDGILATITISADKKVIKFFPWYKKFPLQADKKGFIGLIDQLKPQLEQFVWSPRKLGKIAKKVEDYEAKLQAIIEQIARENQ